MNASPARAVAVRLPLDPGPPIDPFALAGSDGILFHTEEGAHVGLGRALTIALPQGLDSPTDLDGACDRLATISCDDPLGPPGTGIIGFGALPFERSDPARLVVPEITYRVEASGAEWVTVVSGDRDNLPTRSEGLRSWLRARVRPESGRTGAVSSPPSITPLSSDRSFEAMLVEALEAIGRGEVAKVVLARQVDVAMDETIDIVGLLRRWHALEPNCAIFAVPTAEGHFVGASPELLVERSGLRIHSWPLAGTTDRSTSPTGSALPSELLRSAKDGNEHRLVVESIEGALRRFCPDLQVPAHPDLVHLRNITHLGTSLTGTLADRPDGTAPSALHLVASLHPTPAVGGVPMTEARRMITHLEPQSRGHYAGPVGYLDGAGNGRWMLGIRAMTVNDHTARLASGVGIVAGSQPMTELEEANLKFSAVFEALAPGLPFSTAPNQLPIERRITAASAFGSSRTTK